MYCVSSRAFLSFMDDKHLHLCRLHMYPDVFVSVSREENFFSVYFGGKTSTNRLEMDPNNQFSSILNGVHLSYLEQKATHHTQLPSSSSIHNGSSFCSLHFLSHFCLHIKNTARGSICFWNKKDYDTSLFIHTRSSRPKGLSNLSSRQRNKKVQK